jgi:hypothetical protein
MKYHLSIFQKLPIVLTTSTVAVNVGKIIYTFSKKSAEWNYRGFASNISSFCFAGNSLVILEDNNTLSFWNCETLEQLQNREKSFSESLER